MRISEFFEGDAGRMSMTRLMVFLSFWPASWIVVNDGEAETLGWYLSAYVVTYGTGKLADVFTKGSINALDHSQLETTSVQSERVTTSSNVVANTELESKGRPTGRKKQRAF